MPRNEGVTDGPWDRQDDYMVAAAIQEAATAAVVDKAGGWHWVGMLRVISVTCLLEQTGKWN